MQSKPEAGTTLDKINQDVGVANKIFIDNSPKQTSYNTETQRVERLARTELQTTDPYFPWKNKAESVINIIKGYAKRRRVHRNIPNRVWDFSMLWEAEMSCSSSRWDFHFHSYMLTI